jgi:hypothetical protein
VKIMTRTPEEIYEEIEATKRDREALGYGSTVGERLDLAERHRTAYERERDLWTELADALVAGPRATREPWMVAAASAASSNAMEGVFRAEASIERLRERLGYGVRS